MANITPVFKKDDKNLSKNYRPVSVLPILPKDFEKTMQKQVMNQIMKYFSLLMSARLQKRFQCLIHSFVITR